MKLAQALILATSLFAIVNCSKVGFGQGSGSSGSSSSSSTSQSTPNAGGGSASGAQGDRANGSVNQPGDVSNAGGPAGQIAGVGNDPASVLPKVQIIAPPCMRLTNCSITFQLDKTYADRVEFDWKTRDNAYLDQSTVPVGFPYGQPNVQYVPTSGHVVFSPGETSQTVYVRNINPDNVAISIPVAMTNCTYNSLLESCQKYFAP